jgi:hypothetical protein
VGSARRDQAAGAEDTPCRRRPTRASSATPRPAR